MAVEAGRENGISLISGWEFEMCESRSSHLEVFSFKELSLTKFTMVSACACKASCYPTRMRKG